MWYPLYYILKASKFNATCSEIPFQESFRRYCAGYENYFDEKSKIDFSLDKMKYLYDIELV